MIVDINGKDFTIKFVDKINDADDSGQCDYTKQLIKVKNGQGFDQLRDTVLHECTHQIEFDAHLKMSERQVTVIASGIYALLKKNPELREYLFGGTVVEKPMTKTTRSKGTVHKKGARK